MCRTGSPWGDWFTMCNAHPIGVCMLCRGLLAPSDIDSLAMGVMALLSLVPFREARVNALLCRPKRGADSGIYFSGRTLHLPLAWCVFSQRN